MGERCNQKTQKSDTVRTKGNPGNVNDLKKRMSIGVLN